MPKTITKPSGTDWERVKREAAQDAPIPHTAADGPYNPNDAAAVSAYWQQATITRGRGRPAVDVLPRRLARRYTAQDGHGQKRNRSGRPGIK